MTKWLQKIFFIECVEPSDFTLLTLLTISIVKVYSVLTRQKSNFNSDFIDLSQRIKASHNLCFNADDLRRNCL